MTNNHQKYFRRDLGQSKLKYSKMERQLRRIKDRPYPKSPKTESEIREAFADDRVMIDYGYNLNKTQPIYIDTVNNGEHSFCLFASLSSIKIIGEKIGPGRNYSMDATFSMVPHGRYKQFFIIYIEWRGDVSMHILQFIIVLDIR